MHDQEIIEIPISKVKLVLMLLGCMAFVTIGVFFVAIPSNFISTVAGTATKIYMGGCAGIIFFGYVGIFIVKKLFDNTPGLIISAEGITDNSGGLPAGFIPWSEIIKVKQLQFKYPKSVDTRLINLKVKTPSIYIQRQKGALKKWLMKKNFRMYNGISITSNGLKISYDELYELIQKRFADHK